MISDDYVHVGFFKFNGFDWSAIISREQKFSWYTFCLLKISNNTRRSQTRKIRCGFNGERFATRKGVSIVKTVVGDYEDELIAKINDALTREAT